MRPGSLTTDQIHEQLAAPETMRADVERAIDESAKSGKALQVADGLTWNGKFDKLQQPLLEPVWRNATDALADVDRMNDLASQIMECASPAALAAE
jgi:hypothetical protein